MLRRRRFLSLVGLLLLTATTQAQDLKDKLATRVTLDKGIDKDTALRDVLEFLSDRYDIKITIDRAALKKAGIKNAENAPIKLPPQKSVRLDTLLQQILNQVPATFRVKGNEIRVVPLDKVS